MKWNKKKNNILTANNRLKKNTQYLAQDNSHSAILFVLNRLLQLFRYISEKQVNSSIRLFANETYRLNI